MTQGRLRTLDRYVSRALQGAVSLRHGFAGDEHLLLALVGDGEETVAADVLREAGLTHEAVAAALAAAIASSEPPVGEADYRRGLGLNPAAHELIGRAEGIAAGLGVEPAAEHVLLAYLWGPRCDGFLYRFGVTPSELYDELEKRGAAVPPLAPPAFPQPPSGTPQRVFFPSERLDDVLAALPSLLPQGSRWGWNLDGDFRAWVSATGDFDLDELVAQALRTRRAPDR